jgi:hypothetical protein
VVCCPGTYIAGSGPGEMAMVLILDIFVNSEEDAKPEINKLIVENGGRVFKLIENSLSLEDAFFNAAKIRG